MPSLAYRRWRSERKNELDEIESSHAALGGTKRGRRFTTLQINNAYAVMLASQFQGFCRDLHDECIDHYIGAILPANIRAAIKDLLVDNRKLDRGNPNPGNIGSDFGRFSLNFWPLAKSVDARVDLWQSRLLMLVDWRNAIAHQDFNFVQIHRIKVLTLNHVKQCRNACQGLAKVFDKVMRSHLTHLSGAPPW